MAWLDDEYHERLGLSLAVLAAFWLLYVVAAIGYELREPTEALRLVSASLLLANARLLAGVGWLMLDDVGSRQRGDGLGDRRRGRAHRSAAFPPTAAG